MSGRSNKSSDDGFSTLSSLMQSKTEDAVGKTLENYREMKKEGEEEVSLHRSNHLFYLLKGIDLLPRGYTSLDASRPWLTFWVLNPLDLIDHLPLETHGSRAIQFLKRCVDERFGGYGGGPGQLAHMATTYAAINALSLIGTEEAYKSIDRDGVHRFLLSMKHSSGGFLMHEDGELDIRGTYCAIVVATLLGLMTEEITKGVVEYVLKLQTYEGGFSSIGRSEAHGGYTFCGLAILLLMKFPHTKDSSREGKGVDLDRLIHWCVMRQMSFEGGFQGRTNKLVDSCYSFWVGSLFPMLSVMITAQKKVICENDLKIYEYCDWECPLEQKVMAEEEEREWRRNRKELWDRTVHPDGEVIDLTKKGFAQLGGEWLMDQGALQEYILVSCQQLRGFVDKPGKYPDYYHTSYSLSGLSISQNNPFGQNSILGGEKNLIKGINPIINVPNEKVRKILEYFSGKDRI